MCDVSSAIRFHFLSWNPRSGCLTVTCPSAYISLAGYSSTCSTGNITGNTSLIGWRISCKKTLCWQWIILYLVSWWPWMGSLTSCEHAEENISFDDDWAKRIIDRKWLTPSCERRVVSLTVCWGSKALGGFVTTQTISFVRRVSKWQLWLFEKRSSPSHDSRSRGLVFWLRCNSS